MRAWKYRQTFPQAYIRTTEQNNSNQSSLFSISQSVEANLSRAARTSDFQKISHHSESGGTDSKISILKCGFGKGRRPFLCWCFRLRTRSVLKHSCIYKTVFETTVALWTPLESRTNCSGNTLCVLFTRGIYFEPKYNHRSSLCCLHSLRDKFLGQTMCNQCLCW